LEKLQNYQNCDIPALRAGQGPHEVYEQAFNGVGAGSTGVETHAGFLGRFRPLTQITATNELKYFGPHLGPPEMSRYLTQGFTCSKMARQRRAVEVME